MAQIETKDNMKRNYKLLVLVVFIGFLVFGFSENIKGPALPRMQSDFNFNEMNLGLMLSLNSIGYLLASFYTGFLVRKWGPKVTTILAFGTMAVSGILIYLSLNVYFFSTSYFIMYLGNGMLEIALGVLAARIFTKNTGTMMNLAHFFYGLSSAIAPLLATFLMGSSLFGVSLGWKGMYAMMLSLCIIPMLMAFFPGFPKDAALKEDKIPIKKYASDPVAWLAIIIISFGVLSEISAGGWLVYFLEKVYRWTPAASAGMLSAFFLTFTLARLVLGPITDRIGFVKSIFIFSGFSGLCSVLGVLIGESGAFLFAVAGAGIAPVYPTVMAFLARRYQKDSDTAVSFTVIVMGIACVPGNFLIGAIIAAFKNIFKGIKGEQAGLIAGLQAGYLFIGACALICSFSAIYLYLLLKKRSEVL